MVSLIPSSSSLLASPKEYFSIDGAVLTANCLSREALWHLFQGTVSVLRVPHFYDRLLGHQLANWIEHHPSRKQYTHEVPSKDDPSQVEYRYYYVDRVGYPRNQLIGKTTDHPDWQCYFEQRDAITEGIREVTQQQHPIEQLMTELKTHWQHGAELESLEGRSLLAGIGRVTVAGQSLGELPHVDGAWPYQGHFGANIYLRVPEVGGELETWQSPTLSYQEVRDLDPDFDWRKEGKQSWLIQPQEGDLLIVNTRRPHAVRMYATGSRVSICSFIGFDPQQPLKLYS